MKKKPLISIVIPTYNHANFLGRALKSVVDQTYTNWEIVVVDNHSTDNTNEVMEGFIDQRITYLKINNNGIIAASRNMGIREANGEWIAFLDSDDWWTKDKLQKCFEAINDNVDFIYHYLEISSNKPRYLRRRLVKTPQVNAPVIKDLLVNGNKIHNSSVVVRKSLLLEIGGVNESPDVIAAEDFDTYVRIASITDNFICLPHTFGYYFVHDTNTSSIARKDMSISARNVVAGFCNLLDHQEKIRLKASFDYSRGRFNYSNGNYREAIKNFLYATFHHNNFSFRVKALIFLSGLVILKLPYNFVRRFNKDTG